MMKEVEKMSKLGNEDRNLLQHIQEGLAGVKPIDDKWMATIIDAIKNKPEIFKTMFKGKGQMFGKFSILSWHFRQCFPVFNLKKSNSSLLIPKIGGVTDEQIDSYIDMASQMNKFTLKCIAYGIWYISKAAKPLSEYYKKADEYSFGTAKYILMILLFIVLYYVSITLFAVVKFLVVRLYTLVMLIVNLVRGKGATKAAEQAAQSVASKIATDEFADTAASTITKMTSAATAAAGTQAAAKAAMNAGGAAAGGNTNKAQAAGASKKKIDDDEFEF
jgi:hypothetical protein